MSEEDIFSGSTEDDLISRTWKKLERDLKKEGFREGASRGQDEAYQKGFDVGFSEGFRIGEVMGFYKGSLSVVKQLNVENTDTTKQNLLDNNEGSRGCILCENEKSLSDVENLENILAQQQKVNDAIISGFNVTNDHG